MARPLLVAAALWMSLVCGCSAETFVHIDGGTLPDGGSVPPGAFAVSLAQSSLTVGQGAVVSIPITVSRGAGFDGNVVLTATGLPDGLQLSIDNDAAVATLTVPFGTSAGSDTLQFIGTSGGVTHSANLTLNVSPPGMVLLVDHDGSANNDDATQGPSASDALFTTTLDAAHISYDVLRVSDFEGDGLTLDIASGYSKILWYTADASDDQALDEDEAATLSSYLTTLDGDRELLLFSQNGVQARLSDGAIADPWDDVSADTFLHDVLGLAGAAGDVYDDVNAGITVAGAPSTPTQGLSLALGFDAVISQQFDALKPGAGTDVLLTLTAPSNVDVDSTVGSRSFAVALGHTFTATGLSGTKKAVMVSFPLENVVDSGGNTRKATMTGLLAY